MKKLKDTPLNFSNDGNDDDDDKPNFPAGQPPPPLTFNDFPDFQVPPAIPPNFYNQPQQPTIFSQQQLKNTFDRVGSAPIAPGEQVMSEIAPVVEKAKQEEEVENITPADPLLEYFNRADEILKPDFIWQKEQEKEELERR